MRKRKCNIFGHRGVRGLAPENTMVSIEQAWELGCDGIEIDIRLTADEQFILIHDETLDRTTDAAEKFRNQPNFLVSSFNLEQIQQLNAGSWFVKTDPYDNISLLSSKRRKQLEAATVPTLVEVLHFCHNNEFFIDIEIKPHTPLVPASFIAQKLCQTLDSQNFPKSLCKVSSFEHDYLHQVQALDETIQIQALIGDEEGIKQDWCNHIFELYSCNAELTDRAQIEEALARECKVNMYTVNDPETALYFAELGVTTIISDLPHKLFKILEK